MNKIVIIAILSLLGVVGIGGVVVHTASPAPAPVTTPVSAEAAAAAAAKAAAAIPDPGVVYEGPAFVFSKPLHPAVATPRMQPDDTHTVGVVRQGKMWFFTAEAAECLVAEDVAAHLVPEVATEATAAPVVVDAAPAVKEFVPDYDARWGDDKADHPLVWRTGTEPELEKKLAYRGPGKVLENGDVLFEKDTKKPGKGERVMRAPVIPDDIGLGERLVLIDVLVERFGQRRSDMITWSFDDLVACYWAQVKLSRKAAPFPERAE